MNAILTRPWTITAVCAISCAMCAWDISSALTDEELVEAPGLLAFILVLSVVPLVFATAAFLRRNWGRICLAAVSALGVLALPLLMLFIEEMRESIDAEAVLYAFSEVVVIVLLFLPASNLWYQTPRAAAEA